jgi:hypothetical protein
LTAKSAATEAFGDQFLGAMLDIAVLFILWPALARRCGSALANPTNPNTKTPEPNGFRAHVKEALL